tara:strand:- start:26 stop:277 length:252 start_codon:yes stop_codon:yes gene_type:complete
MGIIAIVEDMNTTEVKTNPDWINAGKRVWAFIRAFNAERAITDVTGIPMNIADPKLATPLCDDIIERKEKAKMNINRIQQNNR